MHANTMRIHTVHVPLLTGYKFSGYKIKATVRFYVFNVKPLLIGTDGSGQNVIMYYM